MDIESFYLLLSFIHDAIQVDKAKTASHGGMIIPELCLYCTLRYLAGASYLDVSVFAGISTASFYRIVHRTIHAVNLTDELTINFPQNDDERRKLTKNLWVPWRHNENINVTFWQAMHASKCNYYENSAKIIRMLKKFCGVQKLRSMWDSH